MPGLIIPGRAARGPRPQGAVQINWSAPLARGLVGMIDPGVRLFYDLAALTQWTRTAAPTIESAPGVAGLSGQYNGTTQYISRTAALSGLSSNTGRWCAMGWVTPNTAAGVRNIFSSGIPSLYSVQLRMDDTSWNVYQHDSTTDINATFAGVTANQSYLVGAEWDGANLRLYVDGIRRAQTATTVRDRAGSVNSIGADQPSGTQFWSGAIGPVFLWDRALTDAGHWSLYNPATRWDLYGVPGRRVYFDVGAAAFNAALFPWTAHRDLPRAPDRMIPSGRVG